MWLITPIGFFSIVAKRNDHQAGMLTVRARARGDLLALKKHYLPGLGAIQEGAGTDYRFRATARRAEVSAAMVLLVDDLHYGNFKSEVAKRQGHERADLYHIVWKDLYRLQTDPVFAKSDCKQVIVSVGADGGQIALVGVTTDMGWRFRVETGESALSELLDEDDPIKAPERPWVTTWEDAIEQLDAYPWHKLFPLSVHEEFRDLIAKEFRMRTEAVASEWVDWGQWESVLGMGFK